MKSKKLIIFGAGVLGHLAYEYFTHDSDYQVIGFAVETEYVNPDGFCGLPLIDFNGIENKYPAAEYDMFIALGWYNLNRNRTKFYNLAKQKGYKLASYISTKAFVWPNVEIGDNCMIMEGCILQPWVKICNNVTLWSGCCIEHYSVVKENCTLVARCVVAGGSEIGRNSFLGINTCVGDKIKVAADNFIAMGSVVRKSTKDNSVYEGNPAQCNRFVSAKQFLNVAEGE